MATHPYPFTQLFFACAMVLLLISTPSHAQQLRIFSLQDVAFGDVPTGANNASQSMQFCVGMSPPGPIRMTAFGTSHNGRFALSSSNHHIVFDLKVRNNRFRSRDLLPGVEITGITARPLRRNNRCRRPLSIELDVDLATLRGAPPGNYRGLIQLTVAPE